MKRIISVFAAASLLAGAASAQSLGNLVSSLAGSSNAANTISNVIYAFTGNTQAVSLPGTWNYTGPAISVGGENALANVTGTVASSSVESKVSG